MHKEKIIRILKWSLPALIAVLTLAIPARSQAIFEQSYPYSGSIAQLEKDGPKFYVMDIVANECRLYNMDYTQFKKIKLNVPTDRYLYDIQFITQNLFDNDDGVELLYVFYQYVQTATSYYYIYTTRIADEDGTVLLDLPGGSWTDIHNVAGSGSRMMTYITDYSVFPYPVETRIYRLPGVWTGVSDPVLKSGDNRVYPNPTTGSVNMHPGGFIPNDHAEWVILDQAGKLIARVPVTDPGVPVDLKALGLVSGVYLIRLETKNYQTKFQQVVYNN